MTYLARIDFLQRPITIIGAGTLGRRIALMLSAHGGYVRIYDKKAEVRQAAMDFIQEQLPTLTAKNGQIAGLIESVENMEVAFKDAWLIIEAIPEILAIKKTIFADLDRLAPKDAILASNSSSYPASQFIDNVSEEGRTRVVNMHFCMPPTQNAVEVASCGHTDPIVIDTLMSHMPHFGFTPFVVHKESVGFIFNRIWAAIKRESLDVVATGVSTPEDVDAIFMVNMGSHSGPFELMDKVGLDVVYDIEKHYAELNPSLPEGPRKLLEQYISRGHLGMKTGQGFYAYDKKGNRIST